MIKMIAICALPVSVWLLKILSLKKLEMWLTSLTSLGDTAGLIPAHCSTPKIATWKVS